MQFEDFDNKIRQAAEQHHPNYDEKAWSKMNVLLNKHLPQKEDRRRRFILFLLALLLLGGGATWLLVDKPWKQDALTNSQVSQNPPATGADSSPQTGDINTKEKAKANTNTTSSTTDPIPDNHPIAEPTAGANSSVNSITSKTTAPGGTDQLALSVTGDKNQVKNQHFKNKKTRDENSQFQVDVLQANIGTGKQAPGTIPQAVNEKQITQTPEKNNETAVVNADKTKPVVNDNKSNDKESGIPSSGDLTAKSKTSSSPKDSSSKNQPKTNEEKKTAKKERNKKSNQFFFSLSAGPDVSVVGIGNPGKLKLLTGAGLGYTFRERLTVRTGFYSASKVYVAKPNEYKPSVQSQTWRDNLTNISANCKVYEIPLSFAYSFGKSETHKTFASVGLSSFIMKKETYDYLYEYPSSPTPITHHYIHIVNNENKHYFSVLSLSAGYQRKVNRILSVTAEPYFKLPLAGVGYGKVKLNSFGLMFSVNVSPFTPKK